MPHPDLLLEHAGFLRSLARRLLLDDQQADDVVQQTLLAALQKPPREQGNLRGWLAGVTRNLARMRRRSEGRRARRERAVARPEGLASTAEVAARLDMQRRVVEAVSGLDEPYRSVVVFRFFDELRPDEIARRLDVPVETVKTRLKRALSKLRARFDSEIEGGRKAWSVALLPLALPTAAAKAGAGAAVLSLGGLLTMKSLLTASAVLVAALAFLMIQTAAGGRDHARRAAESSSIVAANEATEPERPVGGGTTAEPAAVKAYDLAAAVRDETGAPVAGATVVALEWVFGERFVERGAVLRTDARGGFRMPSDTDRAHVRIRHPRYLTKETTVRAGDAAVVRLERGAPLAVLVRDAAGKPVSGARVTSLSLVHVMRWGPWSVEPTAERDRYGVAATDATGRAEVGAVPDRTRRERLELDVDHPEYARVRATIEAPPLDGATREVTLVRGGVLSGRVLAADGEPVAGARVFIHGRENHAAATEVGGRWRLAGVTPGERRLFAEAEGHAPGAFGRAIGWGDAVAVTVRDGARVDDLDIVLGRATWATGQVVAEAGNGVAGVMVLLRARVQPGGRATARTDAEGRFRVGPLALTSRMPVHLALAKDLYTFGEAPHPVAEPGAQLDFGVVTAHAPGEIRGVVRGDLPQDLSVRALVPDERYQSVTARVRNGGAFSMRINAGTVDLVASNDAFTSGRVRVELGPGETVDDVELVLKRKHAIAGRVLNGKGDPVTSQKLIAVGEDGALEAWVDVDGAFRFENLPEGEYRVGLVDFADANPDFLPEPAPQTVRAGATGRVEFIVPVRGPAAEGVVVSKRDGRPVTQFTVSMIRYRLFVPSGGGFQRVRSKDGSFRVPLREPGTWAVEIDAHGFAPLRSATFTVGEDGTHDAGTLRLGDAGTIGGTVRDALGQPVRFAQVHVLSAALQGTEDAPFTDPEGGYEVEGLAPGTYSVFVVSPRHPLGILRGIEVKEGARTPLEPTLPHASPLTLIVRDADGQPVAGARLTYTFAALKPLHSGLVERYEPPGYGSNDADREGRIVKPFLPAGAVEIALEADGFEPHRETIELAPGETREVTVTMHRP